MGLEVIKIDENDEKVFEFPEFEIVISRNGNYLLCEEGFFIIDGLENFKKFDSQYVILNEEDKFFITEEDFEKIKEIYIKYV